MDRNEKIFQVGNGGGRSDEAFINGIQTELVYEFFRFLNGLWIGIIGLLGFCWLVMVLLASFIYKRLVFIPKLLKILRSVNKRPQFCVIR